MSKRTKLDRSTFNCVVYGVLNYFESVDYPQKNKKWSEGESDSGDVFITLLTVVKWFL